MAFETTKTFLKTEDIVKHWRPGSQGPDWTWHDEFGDIIRDNQTGIVRDLVPDDDFTGFSNPILLGDDGRVWDGHHRICITMDNKVERLPVEYIGVLPSGIEVFNE